MNDDLGDVDHLGDVDDLGDVDHLGRRTMISKTPLLMMLAKDGEEDAALERVQRGALRAADS